MKKLGSYPLILAGLLQLAPLWQNLSPIINGGGAPAISIIRSLLLLAGVFGSVDALSGASVSIPNQTFNAKVGVKTNFVVNIIQDFSYTISVITFTPITPAGTLPAGFTFGSTEVSTFPIIFYPQIKGTPTTAGTYVIRVTAKENATSTGDRVINGTITVIVAQPDLPATVSTPPAD